MLPSETEFNTLMVMHGTDVGQKYKAMKIAINWPLIIQTYKNSTGAKKDFCVVEFGPSVEGRPEVPRKMIKFIFTDNFARYITPNRDKNMTFILASELEKKILSLNLNIER